MKHIIHVNRRRIKANSTHHRNDAVITVKSYKSNLYGNDVRLYDADGVEVGRFVYPPDKPLSCGAKVYFTTDKLRVVVQ